MEIRKYAFIALVSKGLSRARKRCFPPSCILCKVSIVLVGLLSTSHYGTNSPSPTTELPRGGGGGRFAIWQHLCGAIVEVLKVEDDCGCEHVVPCFYGRVVGPGRRRETIKSEDVILTSFYDCCVGLWTLWFCGFPFVFSLYSPVTHHEYPFG